MTGRQAPTTSKLTSIEDHMPPQASVPERVLVVGKIEMKGIRGGRGGELEDIQVISVGESRPM